jgi:hypothetical protein
MHEYMVSNESVEIKVCDQCFIEKWNDVMERNF